VLRLVLASLHLLGLGVGLGAVWARASALSGPLDAPAVRRVLAADAWWGIAALIWLATGLWRLLAGVEKATGYYLSSHLFWTKMALFAVVFALEIRPIGTFTRWRRQVAAGGLPDTAGATAIAATSRVQAALVVAIVLVATAMARGFGAA
jgi:putative membrane protein